MEALRRLVDMLSGGRRPGPEAASELQQGVRIQLRSAFGDGEEIPSRYTCDGEDVSPPLWWEGVPEGTISLALLVDDPGAPLGTWGHWVLFNLPPDVRELPEGVPREQRLPNGALQGRNDLRRTGYQGPCPPRGSHRYRFRLYALDTQLDLGPDARHPQLLEAMKGHVLGWGELVGTYRRAR